MIDKNTIKKLLYKEKPIATKQNDSTDDHYNYTAMCSLGRVYFIVPVEDMGNLEFEDKISAQLLIRWLI